MDYRLFTSSRSYAWKIIVLKYSEITVGLQFGEMVIQMGIPKK